MDLTQSSWSRTPAPDVRALPFDRAASPALAGEGGETVGAPRLRKARSVDATPLDVVIAGVNKAGTTSLFVSLSEHPQVAPSAVKESRHFLPARYGRPVPP